MSSFPLVVLLLFAAPLGCKPAPETCFGAGTRIATPDGEVAIERLQVGQLVLAFDEPSGAVVQSPVTAVFRHEQSRLGYLTLDDGHRLRVTAEHPIYDPDSQRYREAGKLAAGDALLRLAAAPPAGGSQRSLRLERTTLQQRLTALPDSETVYNLSVATYQSYFADGLLVHNKAVVPPTGWNLPDCLDGQFIAVTADRTLYCAQVLTAAVEPPDCGAVPGSVLNGQGGILSCVPTGTGATHASLQASINKAKQDTDTIEALLSRIIDSSTPAKYCGLYTATPNQSGAITGNNGITGVAGAASLCQTVPGCGSSAHLCTVYELYESAAASLLPTTIPQAWVHMLSWQHNNPAQVPPGRGLADNCSGYTYALDDKLWYGTTVEWKDAPSGHRALHFASGMGLVPCSSRFPIACCR